MNSLNVAYEYLASISFYKIIQIYYYNISIYNIIYNNIENCENKMFLLIMLDFVTSFCLVYLQKLFLL